MPASRVVTLARPSTGRGRCSTSACSACTSMVRLTSPSSSQGADRWVITTPNVGSACWTTSREFSVVNCSSLSGSSWPAPTPSAYSSTSLAVQAVSCGPAVRPTASRFSGIAQPRVLHGRRPGQGARDRRSRSRVGRDPDASLLQQADLPLDDLLPVLGVLHRRPVQVEGARVDRLLVQQLVELGAEGL